MGEKDVSEKILEDYNDVFSDIINGLVFKGEQVIKPEELRNSAVHSQYKADDSKLHELERDVTKHWVGHSAELAIAGFENETKAEKWMPFRVFGYDGAGYRSQLLNGKNTVVPVVTFVLYFGTEQRWTQKKNIKALMKIPEGLDAYVNDFKIHVFEIAWLTEEEVNRFQSDFKVVANFFVKKRKNKHYVPDDHTEIRHVDEVLKLLSVMTRDDSYEKLLTEKKEDEGVHNMCDVAERLKNAGWKAGWEEGKEAGKIAGEKEGREEGRKEGREEGRKEGQLLLVDTVTRLNAGETPEQLLADGIDEKTIELAQLIQKKG